MKRDMDLARKLLLVIEEAPYKGKSGYSLVADGDTSEEVDYHIMLLNEAGLVQAKGITSLNGKTRWNIERLTWQGHEFLDAARNENIWQKAKKLVQEKGGALTFDVAKAVLAQTALRQVGL